MNRKLYVATAITTFALLALASSARAKLGFESEAVTAGELPPGSEVAWLWAGRSLEGYLTRVEYESASAPADRSGVSRLELEREVAEQSIWAAVSIADGRIEVDAPAASRGQRLELPASALVSGPQGTATRLRFTMPRTTALWVRPRVGAWTQSLVDGAEKDTDSERDGELGLAAEHFAPLVEGGAEPPATFAAGDVLVVVDPDRLELWVGILDEATLAAAIN